MTDAVNAKSKGLVSGHKGRSCLSKIKTATKIERERLEKD